MAGETSRAEPGRRGPTRRAVLRRLALGLGAGVGGVLLPAAGRVPALRADEYALIAAFMLRFAEFTTWPDDVMRSSSVPLVAIVGLDPFEGKLDEVFRGEKLAGRPFLLKRLKAAEVPGDVCLVYFGEIEDEAQRALLSRLVGRPALTFSAREGFCAAGGMVTFRVERGKLGFEINREAVTRARLILSSRLLNVARIYREQSGR